MCEGSIQGFNTFIEGIPNILNICYKCGKSCHKPVDANAIYKSQNTGMYRTWEHNYTCWENANFNDPTTFYSNGYTYKVTHRRIHYDKSRPNPGGVVIDEVVDIPAVYKDVEETYSVREKDKGYHSRWCDYKKGTYETDSDSPDPDIWVTKQRTVKKQITPKTWTTVRTTTKPDNSRFWSHFEYYGEVISECCCANCRKSDIIANARRIDTSACLRCGFPHSNHTRGLTNPNIIFVGA